jgi:hypothetical protein
MGGLDTPMLIILRSNGEKLYTFNPARIVDAIVASKPPFFESKAGERFRIDWETLCIKASGEITVKIETPLSPPDNLP